VVKEIRVKEGDQIAEGEIAVILGCPALPRGAAQIWLTNLVNEHCVSE
jgi:hypothetical protein